MKESGGELVILDTAPHSDSAALEAAKVADLVLVPCRPAILDLEAITNTLDLVRAVNSNVHVVMNAVAALGNEAAEAAEAIAGVNVSVCPVQLVNRVAFSRALISGQTAQEYEPEGKAATEANALHLFTCEHLHTSAQRGAA